MVHLVVLDRLLRATTKKEKKVVNIFRKKKQKSVPQRAQTKSWLRLCEIVISVFIVSDIANLIDS